MIESLSPPELLMVILGLVATGCIIGTATAHIRIALRRARNKR